jgi:hypothetical protein
MSKEIMKHERVYEGLMRSDGVDRFKTPERQWWGVKGSQYKIQRDGTIILRPESKLEIK